MNYWSTKVLRLLYKQLIASLTNVRQHYVTKLVSALGLYKRLLLCSSLRNYFFKLFELLLSGLNLQNFAFGDNFFYILPHPQLPTTS